MSTAACAPLADIEDLSPSLPASSPHPLAVPKASARDAFSPSSAGSLIPGVATVYLKTFGCAHNVSDGEYMAGLLRAYGYGVTTEESRAARADAWVLNSCTVKDPSQAAFLKLVQRARSREIPCVVAGCVPQAERTLPGLEGVSVVGVQQVHRIVEVVEQALRQRTVRLLGRGGGALPALTLPKVRKNPLVEIIPLSTGCLGSCTYCKTQHARGKLGSYAREDILARARSVAAEGVQEIWLSSEDTGAYGRDRGDSLAGLLEAVLEALEPYPQVMVRLGMTNPPFILGQLAEVTAALQHPRAFRFLHVPVQSGGDPVLTAMHREYTVADFRRVCDAMRADVPEVTLATDVICGFPGETEEDWEATMALWRAYEFPVTHVSMFYPRPGTPAARMPRIAGGVVKGRSRELTRALEALTPYAKLLGTVQECWVGTERSRDGRRVGHTRSYVKVLVDGDGAATAHLVGSCVEVQVTAVQRWHVDGEVARVLVATTPATAALLEANAAWIDQIDRQGAGVDPAARERARATGACSGACTETCEEACDADACKEACSADGCKGACSAEGGGSMCATASQSECCGGSCIAAEGGAATNGSGARGARPWLQAAVAMLTFLGLQLVFPMLCMAIYAKVRGCESVGDLSELLGYAR